MPSNLTAVDLFAGLGGTSLGARLAGLRVTVAANHWRPALDTHRANHPDVCHHLQDLQQANFHEWPDFDVLTASPACQGHSRARGKERPHHDATRSTAWAVVACVEAKRPRYFAVENVPDFERWLLYPQWRSSLEALGYRLAGQVLDAADCGVPQHRRRLFITGVRQDVSPAALGVPPACRPHAPAESVLDGRAGRWSRVDKPGRSPRVLAQVAHGRRHLGDRFLVAYYGSGSGRAGRPLSRPLGTVTTRDRWALVDGPWMRMLSAAEYRRAMGFPDHYALPRQHKLAVHLLGNAVVPAVAAHVLGTFTAHHAGLAARPFHFSAT